MSHHRYCAITTITPGFRSTATNHHGTSLGGEGISELEYLGRVEREDADYKFADYLAGINWPEGAGVQRVRTVIARYK